MQKIIYNLSGLSFPIKTDNLELTNFLFSFFESSFLKFSEDPSQKNLSENQIFFLSALNSLEAIFIYLKEQETVGNVGDFEKIKLYFDSITSLLEKEELLMI